MHPISDLRQVPWKPSQALLVFLLPFVVLPITIFFWLYVLAPFSPSVETLLNLLESGDPVTSFALVLFDAIFSYTLIAYYLKKYCVSWRELGFKRFSVIKAILTVVLMLVAFIIGIELIYQLVQALMPGFDPNQAQENEFTKAAPQFKPYSLIALVILPPLVEEAIFRGFMFPAFAKRFGLIVGAIFSSAMFGLAHMQPNIIVYTFFIGLVLCFLYARTGSIIPGIVLHMINNYIAYAALSQS